MAELNDAHCVGEPSPVIGVCVHLPPPNLGHTGGLQDSLPRYRQGAFVPYLCPAEMRGGWHLLSLFTAAVSLLLSHRAIQVHVSGLSSWYSMFLSRHHSHVVSKGCTRRAAHDMTYQRRL